MESESYYITWCVGHLVTMSYPEVYDEKLKYWNISTLPFIPKEFKYEIIKNVEKQFDVIKDLTSKDISTIYVATDSGREGEYIYRLVDEMIGIKCEDKKRIWIDSQTEEEILKGITNAKALTEYDALAHSAYLRAKEDYLIGINFSRVLSIVYGKSLSKNLNEDKSVISIGRVMTCVLGMIVYREREIRNFVKIKYYKPQSVFDNILADFKCVEGSDYFNSPLLYNETGFLKKVDAIKFKDDLINNNKTGIVDKIVKKNVKENAPLLFNLAELQNECTKNFKISPDETLKIVQNLYENKMVTYPRTDARVLSTSVASEITKNLNKISKNNKDEEIKEILNKMIKEKYSTNITKSKYVNDDKITDHYAIIPTGDGYYNYDKLDEISKNIFNMITKRFLAIFFPPSEFSKISVEIKIGNETFTTSGKVCINEGYLEVLKKKDKSEKIKEDDNQEVEETEPESNLEILKQLKKGQTLDLKDIVIKTGETAASTRYSSGSIILAMENAGKLIEDEKLREQIKGSGIGTSATRAEIIKKLEKIEYININKKTQILTPTKKGEMIYDIVKASMSDLLNPELTASWEKGLGMVAKKEIKPEEFMEKLEKYIKVKVNKFKNNYY
jgi:DNA topoisomerase III